MIQQELARTLVKSVFKEALCLPIGGKWVVECTTDPEYRGAIGAGENVDEAWEAASMSEIVLDRLEKKIRKH